jgi:phosphate transport system permease protein
MTKPHGITHAGMSLDRLPRRRWVNRLMEGLATLAALVAVAVLAIMVWSVAKRGAGALDWNLLTKTPQNAFSFTPRASGLAPAFVGTFVLVGLATALALPVGVLIAIYLNEYARPSIRGAVSLALDVLNGIPAIVIGIFVFGLLVVGGKQYGFAGAFALACLMLPLVARSTQEVLALVPQSTREASLALGVPKWRTTVSIVLPQTVGGIVTGTILAIARVAGETAPLLFTSSLLTQTGVSWNPGHALWSVPVAIFEYSEQPDPALHAQAWAAALVLLAFILVTGLAGRALAARTRARLGQSR